MKVLMLNTYDVKGGAARAAYRLHKGLQRIGVTAHMLVQAKESDDPTVSAPVTKRQKGVARLKPILDRLPLELYRQREHTFYSTQWLPDNIAAKVAQIDPDVINLHWINDGYLQVETLAKFNKPIVWTLHDMWAFTGGCHYSQECDRYTSSCGACPQLHSSLDWDLSRWLWQRKAKAWKGLNFTIVSPSQWLASCASTSSLLRGVPIEHIPNGIDTDKYRPIDRQLAKKLLGLSPNKRIILFGALRAASDRRKGFNLLLPALQKLSQLEKQDRIELVVFGASQPAEPLNFGFKANYLGKLSDDISLSLLYAAADVFVAPSVQDNLPNTVMESLACGTPCVTYKIGGMPDLIEHQRNGYLAHPFAVEDFAQGIAWVLANVERHRKLSERARNKVEEEFSQELQSRRYLALFSAFAKQ